MPQLIAHQGAANEAPNNTLSAIRQAIALHVDWVEIDIQLSKDGTLVVFHDSHIPQALTGKLAVRVDMLTLPEIKQIDCGSWFHPRFAYERIPTLHEVLSEPFGNASLMLEIKQENIAANEIARATIDVLKAFPQLPPLKIGSFSIDVLREMRRLAPEFPIMGIARQALAVGAFLEDDIRHLAIWEKLLTADAIPWLLAANTCIWAFTVDSMPLAQRLLAEGVNGIITNCSRELLPLFKNKKNIA